MADYQIGSDKPKTSKDIEDWLIEHGMYIHGAPQVKHKPGNITLDDVLYPFPEEPDNRFSSTDNPIKNPNSSKPSKSDNSIGSIEDEAFGFFEIPHDSLSSRETTDELHIVHLPEARTMISDVPVSYTGLVVAAIERKAYNIAFIKNNEMHMRELTTGRTYSIATFDGAKFHIYRGLCTNISEVEISDIRIKGGFSSIRYPNFSQSYPVSGVKNNIKRNMYITLDVSKMFESKVEEIPVNQIIDIEHINYEYDFTIYEDDLHIYLKDWFVQLEDDSTYSQNVPHGDEGVQIAHIPIIEHQKRPDIQK